MTKAAGGELIDLADHVATRHRFVETGREVNSYHTKGIGKCPPGYRVLATAGDGTIEAIRHSYLPWHGWMWHPERETPGDADDFAAVKEIFS
jgi:putative glutamine amidotransferase